MGVFSQDHKIICDACVNQRVCEQANSGVLP